MSPFEARQVLKEIFIFRDMRALNYFFKNGINPKNINEYIKDNILKLVIQAHTASKWDEGKHMLYLLKLLMSKGADINAPDNSGNSILNWYMSSLPDLCFRIRILSFSLIMEQM